MTVSWHDLLKPGDATDFFARRAFLPFEPATSLYSERNALWLAELSRIAYRHDVEEDNPPPQPSRSSFLARAGFRQRRFFMSRETGTQALLLEADGPPGFAVLVFRGTEQSPKDFITDLELELRSLPDSSVAVHEGFRKALDSVWDGIAAELASLTCPVFYTGHSLGGALATLAAARQPPRAAYTFGSPRVGNRAFAASLGHVALHRVVDDQDAVCLLFPDALGYCHVGELHTLVEPHGTLFDGDLSRPGQLLAPPKRLADHAPVNYVDRIPAPAAV